MSELMWQPSIAECPRCRRAEPLHPTWHFDKSRRAHLLPEPYCRTCAGEVLREVGELEDDLERAYRPQVALAPYEVTPPAQLRSRQRPRDRTGRCYELAARYFLDHPDQATLVHGIVTGNVGHAWIEFAGDVVYDGTFGAFYEGDAYRRVMGARVVRRFTRKEAGLFIGESRTYGPCPELEATGAL